jgi:hypothetical protein
MTKSGGKRQMGDLTIKAKNHFVDVNKMVFIGVLIFFTALFLWGHRDVGAKVAQCESQALDKCTKEDGDRCVADRVLICMRSKGFEFSKDLNDKKCWLDASEEKIQEALSGGYSRDEINFFLQQTEKKMWHDNTCYSKSSLF